MEYIELLLIGIFTAILGSAIPGLLNMTVVKIGKQEGHRSAYTFMAGTGIVIAIQVLIAIFLAKFIDFNEHVTRMFRIIGLVVFLLITIYFLFFAKKQDRKKKEKKATQIGEVKQKNKFIYGMFLSSINLFPVPFYVFLSATLKSYHISVFNQPNSSVFAAGVVLGSMIIFGLYLKFFSSKTEENSFILKNINYVIGGVTSVVSLLTIYQLV